MKRNFRYDDESVRMTERFEAALRETMLAFCELMRAGTPEYADCWTWGRCYVGDMAKGPVFQYGGDGDEPDGLTERFAVIIEDFEKENR